ncbi:hypothetical protein [Glycomyces arizonensis]|uniref:hypothetical protein n=1 Tax=Glycomyces arizonensis TaxID=256035 RepID=UPI000414861C|nr:hypothetical protein [Glycomyces arizonensis]
MNPTNGELPEEFRRTATEPVRSEPAPEEPEAPSSEASLEAETLGNGWLLLGIFLLVTIGVLMLLIFASGGNANSSMML